MFDVTEDVIDYFKNETRNEDEFQKIWAELVKWKADRDEEMKRQKQKEEEEAVRRAKTEAQIREKKIETLRDKAATAQAQYMVEVFADTSNPCEFDQVYQESIKAMLDTEKAIDFLRMLEKASKQKTAAAPDKREEVLKNRSDDEKLDSFLKNRGLYF